MSEPLVLGIETSCDETAVGIGDGRVLDPFAGPADVHELNQVAVQCEQLFVVDLAVAMKAHHTLVHEQRYLRRYVLAPIEIRDLRMWDGIQFQTGLFQLKVLFQLE